MNSRFFVVVISLVMVSLNAMVPKPGVYRFMPLGYGSISKGPNDLCRSVVRVPGAANHSWPMNAPYANASIASSAEQAPSRTASPVEVLASEMSYKIVVEKKQ